MALTFSLLFAFAIAQAQLRLVKVNLPSAAMGGLSLSIEKVKKKQYSWQAGINFRPSISGPNLFYNQSKDAFDAEEVKTNWIGAHAEYRFYTQKAKRLHTKPYISIYGNYLLTKSSIKYSGPNKTGSTSPYAIDQNLEQISVGLQYGVQWVFDNKFSIDWTILGFGLTSYQLRGSLSTDDNASVGLLEEALSSIPFIGSKYLFKGNDGEFEVNSQFLGLSPRTALRFGILF